MIPEHELSAKDIHRASMNTLRQHLAWNITGYRCDTEMALNVLLKAASDNSSAEAACAELEAVADSNTMREQLNAALPVAELWKQEAQLNAALAAAITPKLVRGCLEVALDFHDEPFYGKTPELRTYACRDMAKKGTTRFWRVASAYVIWRGLRLTLALTYVLPEHLMPEVVQRLVRRLTHLGLHATILYPDKGFCSGEVIAYLQAQGQAAIIACPIRGKTGGTQPLCQGRTSYRIRYPFTDGTTADIAVVATLPPGKTGKQQRKWLLFVVVGLDWSPSK